MSDIDNPPAFPRPAGPYIDSEKGCANESEPGMTLRDYFAAQAMLAIINDTWRTRQPDVPYLGSLAGGIASDAYDIADAMLKERAKP